MPDLITQGGAAEVACFCASYEHFYSLYNQKPTKEQTSFAFKQLEGYGLEDLQAAIEIYATEHPYLEQNPVPALKEILKREASLKDREEASRIFDALLQSAVFGHDLVIASQRGAYAFKRAFGTVTAFCGSPDTDYQNNKDRQAFVEAYLSASKADCRGAQYVFRWDRTAFEAKVSFVGDRGQCLRIARRFYEASGVKAHYPQTPEEREAALRRAEEQDRAKFYAKHKEALSKPLDADTLRCVSSIMAILPDNVKVQMLKSLKAEMGDRKQIRPELSLQPETL